MGVYFSKPVDKASVESNDSDNLLIPMEDAQHETIDTSDNLSIETTTTDTTAVEKAFLTEISADKKWIAYVVEKSRANQDKQFSLRIKNITYPSTGLVFSEGFEQDITGCMQGVHDFTYCFLSLSSNADRVAISFWGFQSDRKSTKRQTCYVFRVDRSEIKLEKDIECQGKAVFTPDGYLAIVHEDTLNLYNCQDDYRFTRSVDIQRLFLREALAAQSPLHSGAYQVFWKSSLHGPLGRNTRRHNTYTILPVILHLTRFVKYNLLVPSFHLFAVVHEESSDEGVCVWSLTDGARSIPFKTENKEEVFAISSDKTLAATSGNDLAYLHVHQLKSGLLVSKLKSELKITAREQDHQLTLEPELSYYVYFSRNNEYVFLVTIRGDIVREAEYEALLTIEVWNRNAEKSIIRHEKVIEVDWHSKYNLQPYIFESEDAPATFTAVYATRSENGGCLLKSLELELFKVATDSGWNLEPYPMKKIDKLMRRVRVMSLDLKRSDIRYLLYVGQSTIELWRLDKSVNQHKKDLVYIRAFHAPRYHQGAAFEESWILQENGSFEENWILQENGSFESYNQRTTPALSLGIRSMGTQCRVVLDIEYWGYVKQEERSKSNNARVHQEDIHLPFNALEQFEKQEKLEFFCTDFHFIESTCRALYFLYHRRRGADVNIYAPVYKSIQLLITNL